MLIITYIIAGLILYTIIGGVIAGLTKRYWSKLYKILLLPKNAKDEVSEIIGFIWPIELIGFLIVISLIPFLYIGHKIHKLIGG